MQIIHPDTNRPAVIASSGSLPEGDYRLSGIKGSPSDGYSAFVEDAAGKRVAQASNYMDGHGWYVWFVYPKSADFAA